MRGMGVRMCVSTALERFGSNSLSFQAKLFYEEHDLRMATTRSIRHGEQIVCFLAFPRGNRVLTRKTQWNTYGDPPNSDLLRRYGHVDQVPLANGGLGNPADIVEIRADHLVQCVQRQLPRQTAPWTKERVDWWLDQGGDECIHPHHPTFPLLIFCSVFVLDFSNQLPEDMSSFVRLLVMSAPEWEKTKRKSKLPKPKVDDAVLSVAADVVRRRLSDYPTTIEAGFSVELSSFPQFFFPICACTFQDDEALLESEKETPIPLNLKNAVVVRLGEKRILHRLLRAVTARLEGSPGGSGGERDGTGADEG
jgi:SET domain-containing protein 6